MATASPVPLSGQEIKSLVVGATVEIDAPMGYKVPLQYGPNGHVTGQAGGLAYYLGAPTDKGRWWISGDQICHKWSVWFKSELQCLRLRRDGRTIHWENRDGETGTATITALAPVQTAAQELTVPHPVPPAPAKRQPAPEPVQEKPRIEARAELPAPPRIETKPAEVKPAVRPAMAPKPIPAPVPAPMPVKRQPKPTEIAATRIGPPEFMVVNVNANDVLNVRSAPSSEAEIVTSLPPGSRGIVIIGACGPEWCPIQHKSRSGWVHRNFIASERAGSPLAE